MRSFIRFISLVCVLAMLCLGASSCGGGGEDVSVLYYTYSDTYISSVRKSVDSILRSEGLEYHNYDANGNQTTQTEQVDTAITKGTGILAVNVLVALLVSLFLDLDVDIVLLDRDDNTFLVGCLSFNCHYTHIRESGEVYGAY